MTTVRCDDIDTLSNFVSDDYGDWGPEVEITQAMVNRFADMTNDHQWIHVDVERAKDGPFGGTIVHGFFLLALLPRYRAPLPFGVEGETSRVDYGAESYRFLAPVRVGSTVHARSRLAGVRAHAQGTLLAQHDLVSVVGADRPSLSYTGLLLYKH